MFELSVDREFCAAHALRIDTQTEPIHGHNFKVTACVGGAVLDRHGLLMDFHELERSLDAIIAPFTNTNLNDIAPFDRVNPTAEQIARHICDELTARLNHPQMGGVSVQFVRVSEAPGCFATYRPGQQ